MLVKEKQERIIEEVERLYMQADGTLVFPDTLEGEFTKTVYKNALEEIERKRLNEKQHIVLNWLKEVYLQANFTTPLEAIHGVLKRHEISIRLWLDHEQQAQVLENFSEWIQEQEV